MGAKEMFRRYTKALDQGDIDGMAALVSDDFRLEGAGLDGIGKPEFMAAMKAQLDAFPDYSENPTDVREDGDVVHFVAHVHGTHKNTFALPRMEPVPPTDRSFQLPPEPVWVRVRDGKLLLYHVEAVPGGGVDGILSQLGVQRAAASEGP